MGEQAPKRTSGGRGGRRPGAGRPRKAEADDAILGAASAMLRDVGVRGLTVEAVASDAGVSVGSVYRRWSTKSELIAAAYRDALAPAEPVDTGSLRGDLTEIAEQTFRFFTGDHARMLLALMTESGSDPELLSAIQETSNPRRTGLRAIIQRAIDRGEIPPDTDVEMAIDFLVGPLWTRLLVTGRRITRSTVHKVVDMAVAALMP